jgi:hypothetical protein
MRPPEPPPRLVFEEIGKYLPAERAVSYYRVLSRLKHLHPDDDLVVVLEAMAINTWLTRDAPDRMATERKILVSILDERVDRCQTLLSEGNSALRQKIHLADRDAADARSEQRRVIADFRRHIDARAEVASKQFGEVTTQVKDAYQSLSWTTAELTKHIREMQERDVWSKIWRTLFIFGLGVVIGIWRART